MGGDPGHGEFGEAVVEQVAQPIEDFALAVGQLGFSVAVQDRAGGGYGT